MLSNQSEGKDFVTWWKEDFSPALVATRKALEPHVKQWRQIALAVKKHIGHPLLNAPLKKPENFKVNFTTIYVILKKIMKGVEINHK